MLINLYIIPSTSRKNKEVTKTTMRTNTEDVNVSLNVGQEILLHSEFTCLKNLMILLIFNNEVINKLKDKPKIS